MTNEARPVNIWRAWSRARDQAVYLVALYDPDTGIYTRKLNEAETKILRLETVSGTYNQLWNFTTPHYSQAQAQAANLYKGRPSSVADALLRKEEIAGGFSPTVKGRKVTT